MNPKVIKIVKPIFHGLTIASALIAAYGSFVPAGYAKYVALASAAISGALHIITAVLPDSTGAGAAPALPPGPTGPPDQQPPR